jgi:hypothetical protein
MRVTIANFAAAHRRSQWKYPAPTEIKMKSETGFYVPVET